MTAPDTILFNGSVLTLDSKGSRGEALAIARGLVAAVGSTSEMLALRGERTEIIDLDGACVIPGFNDTHAHMEREGLKGLRPSLAGVNSIAGVLDKIREAAAATPAGEWIVTMPVGNPPFFFGGPEVLAERRMPTRHELDAAAPENPVYIPGLFGNWGMPPGFSALNSLGLDRNKVTAKTQPRCAGVEIRRDDAGDPTGVIIEWNPRPTIEFDVLPAVPRFGFLERVEGARRSMRLYNSKGTTSVYEGHGSAPETISVYRRLWERGELTTRVGLVVSPCWADVTEARVAMRDWLAYARGAGLGDPWLRVSGVHIAYGGDKTVAACARAHLPDTGWAGFVEQAYTPAEFRELCFLAAEHDLRLHTIVGDDLDAIVPVLCAVDEVYPLAGRRWVIEHIAKAAPESLATLKRLQILVTTIPAYHLWKGGLKRLDDLEGGETTVAHRLMLDLGLPVAFGTDNIPYDPLFTIWTSVARQERTTGRVIGQGQGLDVETALRLMTVAGSRLTFDEDRKGPLAPGYVADLVVLRHDPTAAIVDELTANQCLLTMVDGVIVYREGL